MKSKRGFRFLQGTSIGRITGGPGSGSWAIVAFTS